jgi:alcohol dehydrogenase
MHRQSLLLTAPRQLEWVIEDLAPLQPHEVLIQTTTGAISIGSELPIYCGTARSIEPIRYPRMTGYESAGVVISCGSHAQRIKIGDRAIASYGHRTHAIISEAKVISIPDNVSDAVALLDRATDGTIKNMQSGFSISCKSIISTLYSYLITRLRKMISLLHLNNLQVEQ